MAEQVAAPEDAHTRKRTWIAPLVVGLVIGLGSGIIISAAFILPRITQDVLFLINPVQVSGTVSKVQRGTTQFINENETTGTRYNHDVPTVHCNCSTMLSGGYWHTVGISVSEAIGYLYQFSLHVPSNVTTLTANFPP